MTGFPANVGSSSTSTAAKNASISTWRMTRSSTEQEPSKPFGELDAHPLPCALGTQAHRRARPLLTVGEPAAMAGPRCPFELDGVGDFHPHVGVERPRQQHRAHLVGGTSTGEVVRE